MMPSAGKSTIGSKLVIGIGMVSQIQKTAMTKAAAATRCASMLMPSGVGASKMRMKPNGARTRPVSARRLNCSCLSEVSGSLVGGCGLAVGGMCVKIEVAGYVVATRPKVIVAVRDDER